MRAVFLATLPLVLCDTFYMNYRNLVQNKELMDQGKKDLRPSLRRITNRANLAANDPTVRSVTAKNEMPPSGNKHDYFSLARYYWPNATGGVWVRIDGRPNDAEVNKVPDKTYLIDTINDVLDLALSYFFTGNKGHSAAAAQKLRAWFLDPKTYMNPNLDCASWVRGTSYQQAMAGVDDQPLNGGLVDFAKEYLLLDAIQILRNSEEFTDADYSGMVKWIQQYASWLQTSPRGARQVKSLNNQGTWYEVQLISTLLFLGQKNDALTVITRARDRIGAQFNVDGSQPLEMVRNSSWHYSIFNLQAHFVIAELARNVNYDYLAYKTPDGKSVLQGLDYLMAYAINGSTLVWPTVQSGMEELELSDLVELAKQAYVASKNVKYIDFVNQVQPEPKVWNPAKLWSPFGAFDVGSHASRFIVLPFSLLVPVVVSVYFLV